MKQASAKLLFNEPSTCGLTSLLAGNGRFAVLCSELISKDFTTHSFSPVTKSTIVTSHRLMIHTPASTEHDIIFQKDTSNQLDENELAMFIRGGSSLLSILKLNAGPSRRNRLLGDDAAAMVQANRIATLFACRDTVEVAAITYVRDPTGTVILILTVPQEASEDDLPSTIFAVRNSSANSSSQSIPYPTLAKTPPAPTTWLKTILNE